MALTEQLLLQLLLLLRLLLHCYTVTDAAAVAGAVAVNCCSRSDVDGKKYVYKQKERT